MRARRTDRGRAQPPMRLVIMLAEVSLRGHDGIAEAGGTARFGGRGEREPGSGHSYAHSLFFTSVATAAKARSMSLTASSD